MRLHLCCMATYPDSSSFSCNGKRDFKIAVYPWKFINSVSGGAVKQWFSQTNPVHIFATFFRFIPYSKILFVSFSLLKITYPKQLGSHGSTNDLSPISVDPHIHYLSHGHLPYVVPAITIIVTLGVLLPLLLNALPDSLWLDILRL